MVLVAVHTRMEVHEISLEMHELVEQSWLQLIYYTVCLPCDHSFRCKEEVQDVSEY